MDEASLQPITPNDVSESMSSVLMAIDNQQKKLADREAMLKELELKMQGINIFQSFADESSEQVVIKPRSSMKQVRMKLPTPDAGLLPRNSSKYIAQTHIESTPKLNILSPNNKIILNTCNEPDANLIKPVLSKFISENNQTSKYNDDTLGSIQTCSNQNDITKAMSQINMTGLSPYSKATSINDQSPSFSKLSRKCMPSPGPKSPQKKKTIYLNTPKIRQMLQLLHIQKSIERQRTKRVREQLESEREVVEKDEPDKYQQLVDSVEKYLNSKEYSRAFHVRDKVFKIPESKLEINEDYIFQKPARLNVKKIPVRSNSELSHSVHSDDILFKRNEDSEKIYRKGRSTFIVKTPAPQSSEISVAAHHKHTPLQSSILDHILTAPPIQTDTQQELLAAKNVENVKLQREMHKRKVTVSKYDARRKSQALEQRAKFRDFLKHNSIEAVGRASSVTGIIKQNFKPVLEMNIAKIERDSNFKRKDLYQVYAHFLSIYRLQQMKRKDLIKSDTKKIEDINGVDYDLFLDNTPVIKYENREMAEKIQSIIKNETGEGQIRWPDFKKYMKLLLAQTFSEKLEVFFETFDLDKNNSFSWDEIFKICHSCLSQMFCTIPVMDKNHHMNSLEAQDDKDQEDFLTNLATYFTKYIFEAVGYGDDLEAEIPFDDMRRVIKSAQGEAGDILKMFCGIDRFPDPVQDYVDKKIGQGELQRNLC